MGGDKKGSGLGTTLVLALVIVVLSVLLGVGFANYGHRLPLLGPLFVTEPAQTTTSPVVVEGIQELDRVRGGHQRERRYSVGAVLDR